MRRPNVTLRNVFFPHKYVTVTLTPNDCTEYTPIMIYGRLERLL